METLVKVTGSNPVLTANNQTMEKLLIRFENFNKKQKKLMKEMSKEKCNDIHSVFRSKTLANAIIELELKKEVLKEAIVTFSLTQETEKR